MRELSRRKPTLVAEFTVIHLSLLTFWSKMGGMVRTRCQRRKEERPREISVAAFSSFAEQGYAW